MAIKLRENAGGINSKTAEKRTMRGHQCQNIKAAFIAECDMLWQLNVHEFLLRIDKITSLD